MTLPVDLKPIDELVERLTTEADLCRNEGADDIARLLDKAKSTIEAQASLICEAIAVLDGLLSLKLGIIHQPGKPFTPLKPKLDKAKAVLSQLKGES